MPAPNMNNCESETDGCGMVFDVDLVVKARNGRAKHQEINMAATHAHPGIATDDTTNQDRPGRHRAAFVFEVDNVTYKHDCPTITGTEIMALAGISPNDGLIQILPDGTRKSVAPDETVHLVPGVQFKRRPRFKRG
jgi:hypothetical protein